MHISHADAPVGKSVSPSAPRQVSSKSRILSPVGLSWLIDELKLTIPHPSVRSEIVSGARKSFVSDGIVVERYPRSYLHEGVFGNLRFALRYEPINLGVYSILFNAISPAALQSWIRAEPTGRFARRAWYLWELLSGKTLDIPDVMPTGYVDLLDPQVHVTARPTQVRRQRINDNLLGHRFFCPLVRCSKALQGFIARDAMAELRLIGETVEPSVLARVRTQFERPPSDSSRVVPAEVAREERLCQALQFASQISVFNKQSLVRLHSLLVDPSQVEADWRHHRTGAWQYRPDGSLIVERVLPKPDDVPVMMLGWQKMTARLMEAGFVEPCLAAAISSLSLLLVHPFERGNRLMQRVLGEAVARRLTQNMPLPLARVLEREQQFLEAATHRFFQSVEPCLNVTADASGSVFVHNETAWLYRYPDITGMVEAFAAAVERTVREEVRPGLAFYAVQESALQAIQHVVDLPRRRANALVRLLLNHRWAVPPDQRILFHELSEDQWHQLEGLGHHSYPRNKSSLAAT